MLGGADLAGAFMRHDLIDEYRLYVHPIVIGQGKPMFQPSDAKMSLHLAEARQPHRGAPPPLGLLDLGRTEIVGATAQLRQDLAAVRRQG